MPNHRIRIRTITAFLGLPAERGLLPKVVADAARFLREAQAAYEAAGYQVQTARIATSSVQERCGGPAGLLEYVQALAQLASQHGISFLAIGPFSDAAYLDRIPLLLASAHVSCSFALPPYAEPGLCSRVAQTMLEVAAETNGAGNFRFCAAANCSSGIPFFPVAGAAPCASAFAIGTENDAVLHDALTAAAATAAAGAGGVMAEAGRQLGEQMAAALLPVEQVALRLARRQQAQAQAQAQQQQHQQQQQEEQQQPAACWEYLGIDTSIAPGLDTPAMTSAYAALLGGPGAGAAGFGGYGTLAISALVTRALKSLPVRQTGYCGLMLAVCEDAGLAEAAAAGQVSISQLLQYSAVCGCGLDTVPVPGPSAGLLALHKQQPGQQQQQQQLGSAARLAAWPQQDVQLCRSIGLLLMDTAALAYRLNKPLACRLLPLPGKVAGDPTCFDNPYLLDCKVMALE